MSVLAPPLAFFAYVGLTAILLALGRVLAGKHQRSRAGVTAYASGERAPRGRPSPGYGPFYGAALFFAIIHVGVLLASTGSVGPLGLVYLLGLLAVLAVVVSV